ncbi:MAG: hypothetical protein WBZ42_00795 [Halobacteriota archaeon]
MLQKRQERILKRIRAQASVSAVGGHEPVIGRRKYHAPREIGAHSCGHREEVMDPLVA